MLKKIIITLTCVIYKALEYGSNTDPDPQHRLWVLGQSDKKGVTVTWFMIYSGSDYDLRVPNPDPGSDPNYFKHVWKCKKITPL